MLRLLLVPASFYLLSQFQSGSPSEGNGFAEPSMRNALSTTVGFILISMTIALGLDWKILYHMYFNSANTENRLVPINWIISNIFLISLPSVILSQGDIGNEPSFFTKAALILSFSCVSYLMFYFVFALQVAQKSSNVSSGAWKQFVPPMYYLLVTLFAYRAHHTIAVTISSVFLGVYAFNLFGYNNFKGNQVQKPEDTQARHADCDWENASGTTLYSSLQLVEGSQQKIYIRQLGYDLAVYCLPMILVGAIFPSLRTFISCLAIFGAFARKLYETVIFSIFLSPTPLEHPQVAAKRLETYAKGSEYPTGWFRVANAEEVPVGRVKFIVACGRELAVFRGEDGKVRAVDPYCTHLGANMAIGGKVVGNCLQCPFHLWEFDGTGKCTAIPYSDTKIPSNAKVRAYYVHEYFDQILVWFRIGETEANPPDYYPPTPRKMDGGNMTYFGQVSLQVNMHIQEFAENSTDFAHFAPVHGTMTFPYTLVPFPLITINHRPGWKDGKEKESHMCWFLDSADINFMGKRLEGSGADATITFVGPASVVFFTFDTPLGIIQLFQTHTPRGPLRLETQFRYYAEATMPRILVWYIVGNWVAQWQNDIMLWENKKHFSNPILVKGDGPMSKQRRWFKQFYVNPSDLKDAQAVVPSNDKTLEW